MTWSNRPHKVFPGDVFGYMTVIEFSHKDKRWRRHYLCRCKCGVEKTVQGTLLRAGNTKSCGCWSKESARTRAFAHGVAAMNQVIAGYRHKADKSGIGYHLTNPQFKAIATAPCFYCGSVLTNICRSPHGTGDFAYNGLDKIDPSKDYRINNVVPCCKRCNFAKSNRSQGDFIRWIKAAHDHLSRNAMASQWG